MRYDEYGRPILTWQAIEALAEELIRSYDPSILDSPRATPIMDIVEYLHETKGIGYDYTRILGRTEHNNAILGSTSLKPLVIYIDASLYGGPRFNFTLGHELGHAMLHVGVDVERMGYEAQEMVDSEYDMATGRKRLVNPRDWIEWQANRYASAILMPRRTVAQAVVDAQTRAGMASRLGRIFLENRGYSLKDYRAVSRRLVRVFRVNATNVEYRLKELGILDDRRSSGVKHISQLLKTMWMPVRRRSIFRMGRPYAVPASLNPPGAARWLIRLTRAQKKRDIEVSGGLDPVLTARDIDISPRKKGRRRELCVTT